jgi:hypothetical protein
MREEEKSIAIENLTAIYMYLIFQDLTETTSSLRRACFKA